MTQTKTPSSSRTTLIFGVGPSNYAVDVRQVQELIPYQKPTHLVMAPEHVRGVIDLRGSIITLVDMRTLLRCPKAEISATTLVLVVNVTERLYGLVVDAVTDVHTFSPDDIREVPTLGWDATKITYMEGLAEVDGKLVQFLNLEQLLSFHEVLPLEA